jgi:acetyl esterase/lipase
LDNGPQSESPAEQIFVAGDSAGGNLALSLVAWLRDQKMRQPDAVVAFSPLTDATLSGASVRENENSDIMLKSLIAPLNRIPDAVRIWVLAIVNRTNPANPAVSPLFGNLADLPPILLQASESEMLLDDSRRYFCKANAAGSPVKLQTWADVMHVWQLFDPELPQARQAWQEIEKFIRQHSV